MIAWLLVALTLAAGYGWAARLLREQSWLSVLLGLAISAGGLTLIMLGEGLLGIRLTFVNIALPYFALMLAGWWRVRLILPHLPTRWEKRFALLVLVAISAANLFNGAYLPFYRSDTLGIYQPAASEIYRTGALVPLTGADSLYRAYPILIPLSYTYAYLAAGWENEYLAKTIATVLSLACIPAAYLLGKRWRGERVGWLAALILTLTPFFSRWASSGYVDLPMAFFYTLAAVFALRLRKTGSATDAALAGALIGLAAWTKNAGLSGIPVLAIWLVGCGIQRKIGWRTAAISLIACAAIIAPWYLRNLAGAGFLIPDTAWTDQAQHTLDSALVFASRPQDFGLPGLLILFGIIVAVRDLRRKDPITLLLLLWTLPFFAAWWLLVSYDPRFLLLFLPPLCVLASEPLVRLWDWFGATWQPRYRILLLILIILLTAQVVWNAVEYKPAILRNPLMSDDDKHSLVGRE
ncbi:MAG: glycosyltransferase family 39 protein [Chloroflexota bacterium]